MGESKLRMVDSKLRGGESTLRVAEIFASVQGEGIWAGTPSTFVRVSGCNLRCRWCDTPYASWRPEGSFLTPAQIAATVIANSLNHVVLTGGEPMIFEPVVELSRMLRADRRTITVETAGTSYLDLECDLMSISPKLANSTPDEPEWSTRHERTRTNLAVLRALIADYPYQLKFVVNPDAGDDLAEIERLLDEIGSVDPARVLLMPEGTDSENLWRRARLLVEPCMRRNWRLAPRLHIDLFGNTKGT